MEYILKEKSFTMGDDFVVKDKEGNKHFLFDGKAFRIGEKLIVKDAEGNKLGHIRKKMISLKKTYEVYKGEELIAKVKKKKGLFRKKIKIDVGGKEDYKIKGNMMGREYSFLKGKKEVATVSKKRFKIQDSYSVVVSEEEDPLLILATAVIIDLIYYEKDNK